jgi:uncharacterized membrane protein
MHTIPIVKAPKYVHRIRKKLANNCYPISPFVIAQLLGALNIPVTEDIIMLVFVLLGIVAHIYPPFR